MNRLHLALHLNLAAFLLNAGFLATADSLLNGICAAACGTCFLWLLSEAFA